jgi:hypothetical protein
MIDRKFPKAKLFSVIWRGMPVRIGNRPRRWRPLYTRIANAAILDFLFWEIVWRMSWLPSAAYAKGWDACFRQLGPRK